MNNLRNMVIFLIILSIAIAYSFVYSFKYNVDKPTDINKKKEKIQIIENPLKNIKTFTITAVGDCTIGWDTKFGKRNRFDTVFAKNNNDYGYFFKLVKSIFEDDDLTYANFEGTLTNETEKVEKKFNFKASPDYVKVLKEGNIEIVGLANNHSYDYGNKGLEDTKSILKENKIGYFGGNDYLIKEVNGLKIGFFGLIDIMGRKYNEIDKAISYLKEQDCDLIIAAMHWGIEKDYNQSNEQIKEGHYLIDNGVDLVIGTHPHVIQGIEKYKDRYIIYSLANFSFGGNPNPSDKDTFIYRQTFTFVNNELLLNDNVEVIPASVSSTTKNNNYQPTVVMGERRSKIINKINKNSNLVFK